MSIFQTIATDTQLISNLIPLFFSNLSENPVVQKIESALPEISKALVTRQATFKADGYTVTAKLNGSPTTFTLSAAILGIENVISGKTGVFPSGDIEIDITPPATLSPQITAAPATAS